MKHCIKCIGNYVTDLTERFCDTCLFSASQPAHKGHFSLFGTYWCDTCNSPYCELA